jgi:hypothetical protein
MERRLFGVGGKHSTINIERRTFNVGGVPVPGRSNIQIATRFQFVHFCGH